MGRYNTPLQRLKYDGVIIVNWFVMGGGACEIDHTVGNDFIDVFGGICARSGHASI